MRLTRQLVLVGLNDNDLICLLTELLKLHAIWRDMAGRTCLQRICNAWNGRHPEHPQTGLIRSWLIHGTCALRCVGKVVTSTILHKQWRRSLITVSKTNRMCGTTAACFNCHKKFRTRFGPDGATRAIVVTQSHDKMHNWHANSSRGSIIHLGRERIAPRDPEPNLSQMSHSFWLHSEAHNSVCICKQLKRPVAFSTVQIRCWCLIVTFDHQCNHHLHLFSWCLMQWQSINEAAHWRSWCLFLAS